MNGTSPEPHDHHHAMPQPADVSVTGHEQHGMTGHAGHGEAGAHDRHAGHSVAMFRDKFWITLLLSIPTLLWSGMVQHMFGFSAPTFPGSDVRSRPLRHRRLSVRRVGLRQGWTARAARSQARDDDADLPGDHRRIRLQPGGDARISRRGVVVGTGLARDDHAARSLDRDAFDLSGVRCPARAGEAAAQHGATHRRRDDRRCADLGAA